jgi:hypothetical protein
MGLDKYSRSKKLIEDHFEKDDEVGVVKLSMFIMKEIGADDRTVESYLKVMINTRLIKDIGNCHFQIC